MWGETKVRRAGRGGPLFCALSWFFRGRSQAAAPLRSACHVATQECGSRGAQSFSFAVEFLSVLWNPIFKCWQLFHMFKESTLASLTRVPGNCFWKLNRDTETTGTACMGDAAQDSEPEGTGKGQQHQPQLLSLLARSRESPLVLGPSAGCGDSGHRSIAEGSWDCGGGGGDLNSLCLVLHTS